LGFPFHSLGIDVKIFSFIFPEPAFVLEFPEVLGRLVVNLPGIVVCFRWKVYFRFDNVKKGEFISSTS
jgi:hypothetical protein